MYSEAFRSYLKDFDEIDILQYNGAAGDEDE